MTTLPRVSPTLVAAVAAVVALVALLLALGAQLRVAALRRRLAAVGADGSADPAAAAAREHERLTRLGAEVDALRTRLDAVDGHVAAGLRHVAVVRYDAFGDMGGRLSFSAALVDDAGDGLVLSSIHARGESRTYAKGIVAGSSEITLTPEEQQALAAARTDRADA
ncbi:uncharacterized protein DUF4446 [Barrientosiimonas humi]|uniref:Uncharacterized protein DUF4446 n=1 Tax=Barrientosiimonas humi TaxID=999931 RepID=A0A542XGK0_9MICO|nr:uncharacterized protein DUF4446 [Barrientosiimonas humi]CAG7571131.1 hypothetical protein BH39T_PBIAJDOK_00211 [Barrientosiimonas humi]